MTAFVPDRNHLPLDMRVENAINSLDPAWKPVDPSVHAMQIILNYHREQKRKHFSRRVVRALFAANVIGWGAVGGASYAVYHQIQTNLNPQVIQMDAFPGF